MPVEYHLAQNYPNPFNPGTVIRFDIPVTAQVTLEVFNILGQRVALLVDQPLPQGRYDVEFDGTSKRHGGS